MSSLFVHHHTNHGIVCYDSDKDCYITQCGPYQGDAVLCIVCVCVCVFVCVCACAFIQPERGFFCIIGFVFHLLCYPCCPSSTDDNILMSAYNTKTISITIVSPHTQTRTNTLTHAHVAWFYLAQRLKFHCVLCQGLELNSIGINWIFTYQEQISEHFVLFPVCIPLCPPFVFHII